MKRILRHIILAIALAAAGTVSAVAAVGERPGVETEVGAQAVEIRTGAHSVELFFADDNTHDINVFSITGQAVKSFRYAGHGSVVVDLAPGYYIIKVDNTSRRILVR